MTDESSDTLFQRGNALLSAGRCGEAIAFYQEADRRQPGRPETLANLGVAYAELGRLDEALRWYDAALAVRPNYPEALYNRGNALRQVKRPAEALASYDGALRATPAFAEAWANRGLALMMLGRAADAAASYRESLRLRPGAAEVHNNLGLALQMLGRVEEALDHFGESIRLRPDFVAPHANRAQARLLKADFRRGWPEYEWRWRLPNCHLPPRPLPAWDGSPLAGRTVLLRGEQGMGDTIQFARFAPQVKVRGGSVVLECPRRLHPLLKTLDGIDALVDRGEDAPGCDLQLPLLSLPGLFRIDLRSIPSKVPYLSAEPERVERWRGALPASRLRIGICWQGNPDFPEDAFRSPPLSAFAPLAELPGVRLVNLQLGPGTDQISAFRERFTLHDLGPDLDTDGAFLDTAAVMMSLDLIVSGDTSIAHLAGALGRPVWLALAICPEWRWLRDRDDSPWYPTARLFRQPSPGDWADVFGRMAEELAHFP